MKNSFFKYSTITFLVLACILCSCKGKERAEYNDTGQIDLESFACDSIKEMAEAFPRIENYKGFKLKQVICLHESRSFSLIYYTKDSLSRMGIDVSDIRLSKNSVYLIDTKQRFELAQGQFKNRKASKLLGEYASISTIYPDFKSKTSTYITSFQCILKDNYAVKVFITQNKKLVNFESFFKDYVTKINSSKLK